MLVDQPTNNRNQTLAVDMDLADTSWGKTLQTFCVTNQIVNTLGFVGHNVSVVAVELCLPLQPQGRLRL